MNVSSLPPDSERQPVRTEAAADRETEAAGLIHLMTLCARGHEQAFPELYDRTSQRIYGIILRVLRSPDHAAEVMQEVYVEVWRQSARYSPRQRQCHCLDDHHGPSARGGSSAIGVQ